MTVTSTGNADFYGVPSQICSKGDQTEADAMKYFQEQIAKGKSPGEIIAAAAELKQKFAMSAAMFDAVKNMAEHYSQVVGRSGS